MISLFSLLLPPFFKFYFSGDQSSCNFFDKTNSSSTSPQGFRFLFHQKKKKKKKLRRQWTLLLLDSLVRNNSARWMVAIAQKSDRTFHVASTI
jgi:hypothetical protein